jgi:hypothetical protein
MAGATSGPPDDGHDHGTTTLTFDVEFSPFNYTDLGQPGPSAGDVIVFNDVLRQDGSRVGRDSGSCVVIEAQGLANCTGVVTLDEQGTITFAFENAPPPLKTLAITGGSGAFRTVRGDGVLEEFGNGTGRLTLHVDGDG